MAAIQLHMLKPSVNNMTVRVFLRAAKLDFKEDDAWGKTRSPEFLAKNPAHMTPMIEAKGLPKGALWESCAIMQYLCNKHDLSRFYPKAAAKRAMIDSAMFYLIGTLYPLVARATYPALGFPQYAGEVGTSSAGPEMKAEAQKAAAAAIAGRSTCSINSTWQRPFIGGKGKSIADIKLASTSILAVADYGLGWAKKYMGAGNPSARPMPNRPPMCAAHRPCEVAEEMGSAFKKASAGGAGAAAEAPYLVVEGRAGSGIAHRIDDARARWRGRPPLNCRPPPPCRRL
jgi:glutathione S-transferase